MTNKFTLYCGLNDKITGKQEITTDNAIQVTKNIVCGIVGYGTISQAQGVYTMQHDKMVISENTIRIEFTDTDINLVSQLAQELKTVFNQESILFEEYIINSKFI